MKLNVLHTLIRKQGNIKWILKKYSKVVYTDTLYTVVTWQLAERERHAVYNMEQNSVRWAIIFIWNSKTMRRILNQPNRPTNRQTQK